MLRKCAFKIAILLVIICCSISMACAQKVLRSPSHQEAAISNLKAQLGARNKIISLTLRDADVQQALRVLAAKAGVNIVFQDSVTDMISLDLSETSVVDAIAAIFEVSKFDYKLKHGALMVSSKEPEEPKVLCTPASLKPAIVKEELKDVRTVKVNYANAFLISDFLNENLVEKEGKSQAIAAAQGLNEVILVGSKQTLDKAQQVVHKLDVKPRVAVFKLNYVTPDKMANIIASSIFNKECEVLKSGEIGDGVYPFSIYYDNKENSLTIIGATDKQLELTKNYIEHVDIKRPQALLEILMVELTEKGVNQLNELCSLNFENHKGEVDYGISKGKFNVVEHVAYIASRPDFGKILAHPKLTVSNYGNYEINMTSDYIESTQGANVYKVAKDCGVNLKIASLITPNKEVVLDLAPSYKTVKRFLPNEKNPKATLLNRKRFSLKSVRLQDLETLGIGGMVSQKEYRTTPVLSFFGLGKKKIKKTEFMIFVRVHVLD